MRILFIHPDFPGPFRHLALALGGLKDMSVLFLSERRRKGVRLPGVRRLSVPNVACVDGRDDAEREMRMALQRGANTANALLRLRHDGFMPDIVYAASGTGNSLYVRDIFPEAFYAVYAEWFYTRGATHTFFNQGKPRPPVDFAPCRIRNLCQLNALADCDFAATSTQWQKKQFPARLANAIQVIHEGIDTRFFSPAPSEKFVVDGCDLSHVRELVTFSGRSLEPFRGFPQFRRSLPRLLAARPDCHVLIMVPERTGATAHENDAASLAALRAETPLDEKRVHFLGFRPYEEYRRLLRASTVHVYLTAPFSLSSGLFEALSCGCLVVGSDTEPVREVIRDGENGFLRDFWDADALADTIGALLDAPQRFGHIRENARRTILQNYDRNLVTPLHLKMLDERWRQWKKDRSRMSDRTEGAPCIRTT